MLNKDIISAAIILIISGIFWSEGSGLSEMGGFFPRIIIIVLALFSGIQLIQSLIKKNIEPAFAGVEAKRLIPMIIGVIAYVGAIILIGFALASLLFLAVFFKLLDNTKKVSPVKSVVIASLITAVFYGVFNYAFLVPLPVGIVFGG